MTAMIPPMHEIRDPIYNFITLDEYERRVLDSWPLQRLRQIHQLAMTYMVYPGATHKRFEHSLGVMHQASEVFDIITNPENVRSGLPKELLQQHHDNLPRWRRTLRMAALCHDIGHLPFSHAAEDKLLPTGWDHEKLTVELILSDHMANCWEETQVEPVEVAKLAVGPKKWTKARRDGDDGDFSEWERLLAEIISGDAFGVDRMDYLLRDSYHCGVKYGIFDHHRLIQNLRILPEIDEDGIETGIASIGLDEDGIHAALSMLQSRNSMFAQVYFHRVRQAYDTHLKDFLVEHLPDGKFSIDLDEHLATTDANIQAAIEAASMNQESAGSKEAKIISGHQHFKTLYRQNPADHPKNPRAVEAIFQAACEEFGASNVRKATGQKKTASFDFPVRVRDGSSNDVVMSSVNVDDLFKQFPGLNQAYVFVSRDCFQEAKMWLKREKTGIL